MRLLAIDTSFDACSAAILDGGDVLWSERKIIGRGHAEVLPPMVAEGFRTTGIGAMDLGRIGVVIGPGAFAGIRVGVAFARGLCLGTKAHAVGVTSLAALAASILRDPGLRPAPQDEDDLDPEEPSRSEGVTKGARDSLITPIFDARRGQVYAALYDKTLRERIAPFVAAPEEAAARLRDVAGPFALAGSGAAVVAPHLSGAVIIGDMESIDPVAVADLAAKAPSPTEPPAPLYLRPPDAKPSSGGLFAGLLPP